MRPEEHNGPLIVEKNSEFVKCFKMDVKSHLLLVAGVFLSDAWPHLLLKRCGLLEGKPVYANLTAVEMIDDPNRAVRGTCGSRRRGGACFERDDGIRLCGLHMESLQKTARLATEQNQYFTDFTVHAVV
ncbi:unnamed protein product [Pieris macdunnoughi]|uniref:Uncharacterized protein n=1 Tax=Pieris macdunnoughi TaxID=345717 RepID=A0A821TJK4_9NEOP|nr:unnamed protein product [Pieris macdunnoughi]